MICQFMMSLCKAATALTIKNHLCQIAQVGVRVLISGWLVQGQKDLKESHWHPQIQGMLISTSADGFNVFRPSNLDNLPGAE